LICSLFFNLLLKLVISLLFSVTVSKCNLVLLLLAKIGSDPNLRMILSLFGGLLIILVLVTILFSVLKKKND